MALRRNPIETPDLRYLRRRANRRVRKARRTRTLLRLGSLVLSNLLVSSVLLYGGFRAVRLLAASPVFRLEAITVDGVERTSADALRQRLEVFIGRNLLELELRDVAQLAADDRWVRSVAVKRILPQGLRVSVDERRPVAVAAIGGLAHVVDAEGFVIGPSGPETADSLPVLTGLEGLERDALREALARGVRDLERLSRVAREWGADLSELDLGRAETVVARTIAPGPPILLDRERIERNLEQYLMLRAEIEERVGAAEYVDLRWSDRISVMPAEGLTVVEQ